MNEPIRQRDALDAICSDCKHMFDAELTEAELTLIRESLNEVLSDDEEYRRNLADMRDNACSDTSRTIAAEIEHEECAAELFERELLPRLLKEKQTDGDDLNASALYVEYLANHAQHEVRRAFITAYRLKLRSKEKTDM